MATFAADGGAGLRHLLDACGTTQLHPSMQGLFVALGSGFSAAEFGSLLARISIWRMRMLSFFSTYDVILAPVNAFPAPLHGGSMEILPAFSYTAAYNLTGWPGATVRCGLPIGVQAIAHPWREDVALAIVEHLETVFGGWEKPELGRTATA